MWRVMAAALLLVLLSGCSDNDSAPAQPRFTPMGLDGRIVYRLEEIDGALYAATDRGFFRHTAGRRWQRLGNSAWRIMDWANPAPGHWLLSIADGHDYEPISSYGLVESLDDGATWTTIEHDFGGDDPDFDQPEPIRHMTVLDGALYAVGYNVLARSTDHGRHWTVVAGDWRGFGTGMGAVTATPDGNSIWYGGQGGMENPLLFRKDLDSDEDAAWFDISELLPAPSTVKGIRFHPAQASRFFVAGEGGIIESSDNGASWQAFNTHPDYRFYFDVAFDAADPARMYTAGWAKVVDDPQPLVLEVTRDDGATWQHWQHPDDDLFGGVYSMLAREEDDETVLYLGLFKGGVMRVSDIP